MENEPEPKRVPLILKLPLEFVEECERRGLDVERTAERIMTLAFEVERDGKELLPNWKEMTNWEQLLFMNVGAHARFDLETPPEK